MTQEKETIPQKNGSSRQGTFRCASRHAGNAVTQSALSALGPTEDMSLAKGQSGGASSLERLGLEKALGTDQPALGQIIAPVLDPGAQALGRASGQGLRFGRNHGL